ncbi:hypothetical protein OS493_032389 [Desmophyllum pertusum]|uniref:Uncharacterized protein n=1 Tax=Desmophyllum pertusum TaxID=174260 RepID=A0A9W9Y8I8_9CNID|nr:hypothetical protein OS493_032389 [Desmophyllum pertusum]
MSESGGDDIHKNGKGIRCREPSRLPLKQMKQLLKKRKLRKRMRIYLSKNVPKTSSCYQMVVQSFLLKGMRFGIGRILRDGKEALESRKYVWKNGSSIVSSRKVIEYRSVNHRIKDVAAKLCGDIETNPGPVVVDCEKTICAAYSQGNALVFGSNAGKQCVAMSLLAIVYNLIYGIKSSSDLVGVMDLGNELYTHLSNLTGQDFLMLSDLTGDDQCVPLVEAFQLCIEQNFKCFLLTIVSNTVAIFQMENGAFKVFDSHSRDLSGNCHPHGTCVLLEIASVDRLVEYFSNLNVGADDALYEVRGVDISEEVRENVNGGVVEMDSVVEMDNVNESGVSSMFGNEVRDVDISEQVRDKVNGGVVEMDSVMEMDNLNESGVSSMFGNDTDVSSCKECYFVCLYAVCFSVIKGIGVWNEETLDGITEKSKQLYEKLMLKECCRFGNLPDVVKIDIAEVKVCFNVLYKGTMGNKALLVGIEKMEEVIKANEANNTGFLLRMSELYISCIFKRRIRAKVSYAVFGLDESMDRKKTGLETS